MYRAFLIIVRDTFLKSGLLLLFLLNGVMVLAQGQTGCIKGDCYTGEGTYVYSDGSMYLGEFFEGKASGFGVLNYANGNKYVGQFLNHEMNGYGAWHYPDGRVLAGNYDYNGNWSNASDFLLGCLQGNCQNGYGEIYWEGGTEYFGDFVNGQCHGFGSCYYNDGSMYVGEWENHQIHGYGVWYKVTGEIVRGYFENGTYVGDGQTKTSGIAGGCIDGDCTNGIGTYVYEDGSKYIGEFVESKCNGFGVCYFANSNTYVGQFRDHRVAGQGAWYYTDGRVEPGYYDTNGNWVKATEVVFGCLQGNCENGYGVKYWKEGVKYEGNFLNGNCHGFGTCYFADGSMYIGNWANHKFDGQGTRYYKDGAVDRGIFRDGNFMGSESNTGCLSGNCLNGFGIYRWEDNSMYSGEFLDGKINGYGTYFFADGDKYVGYWKNSAFEGEGTYTYKNGEVESGVWKNNVLQTLGNVASLKAEVSWNEPSSLQSSTTYNSVDIKACIQSNSAISRIRVLVNNAVVTSDTRFSEDPLSGCTVVYSKTISLQPGENQVSIEVENEAGISKSSERIITLTTAGEQKRLALVIGNSAYQFAKVLNNPVNDARAISDILRGLGFEVKKLENASARDMKAAIDQFGQDLEKYEVGLFYYAGHGIQSKGLNYLVPVDADIQNEAQIDYDCIRADRVMSFMEYAQTDVNIIILDACRNDPFQRSWSRSASGEGLAFMNAPTGTLIAYATAPGRTASDGDGTNGLYTEALLQEIKNPDLSIIQVFQRVRTRVSERSGKSQIPWESTSLTGDFYFSKKF